VKRPRTIKDRQAVRDAIIEDLQADELERLAGMRKLPERAKRVISERAVVARERVTARKAGEADGSHRLR
jgi:hypothetical protein